MRLILKILLAPVMIVLAFLIWFCTLTLHISAVLLNILSVLLVLVSIFSFIDHNVKKGLIELRRRFCFRLMVCRCWARGLSHSFICCGTG